MLALTRNPGESVVLTVPGFAPLITVQYVGLHNRTDQARLAFDAPRIVQIDRWEVYQRNKAAALPAGVTTLADAVADAIRDPDKLHAAESSYRRGFHQGISAAIDAVKCGANVADLCGWCNRVARWREWRPLDMTPPPNARVGEGDGDGYPKGEGDANG
jgi:sRNA-binding carbon storage regulator CsrA